MTDADVLAKTHPRETSAAAPTWPLAAGEVVLIFLVLFLWAGGPPPDTNEAHYLAKARHYWAPEWSEGDFFLESADAHLVFYWTFGWVAALLPLPAAAWVGRIAMWGLQAWSWRRLSWAVAPKPLFSVLSAALFLVLLDWGELAGEWVADGVEAKGFAFAFVFLGIEAIIRNRWNAAWLLLGAASAFHILVGGWTILAAGFAWLISGRDRPRLLAMLPALIGGFLLSLPGLIPGIMLTRGLDAETVALAKQIYVHLRLSHHLVPSAFPASKYAAHLTLIAVGLAFIVATARMGKIEGGVRRLWGLASGAVLIEAIGFAIYFATQHDPALAASLLRFYFFRLSDAFVPLAVALTLGVLLIRLESRSRPPDGISNAASGQQSEGAQSTELTHQSDRASTEGPVRQTGPTERPGPTYVATMLLIAAMLIAAAGVGARYWQRQRDFRPGADRQSLPSYNDPELTQQVYEDWLRATAWIRKNTPPDARFLTPRAQQTFKWYAHRPEVVSWKDVPQDAAALIEWRRRFLHIYRPVGWRGLTLYSDEQLRDFARKYDFQYIVIDRTRAIRRLGFQRVYPESPHESAFYEVYRVDNIGYPRRE